MASAVAGVELSSGSLLSSLSGSTSEMRHLRLHIRSEDRFAALKKIIWSRGGINQGAQAIRRWLGASDWGKMDWGASDWQGSKFGRKWSGSDWKNLYSKKWTRKLFLWHSVRMSWNSVDLCRKHTWRRQDRQRRPSKCCCIFHLAVYQFYQHW